MWLLPWEKWLPPWLFGPLLCVIAVAGLYYSEHLSWWKLILLPVVFVWGVWGTWVWLKEERNIFK